MSDSTGPTLFRHYRDFLGKSLHGGWGWVGGISTALGIGGPIMAYFWPESNTVIILLSAFIPFAILAVCLIVGPLMGVLRAYQGVARELAKANQDLEESRKRPAGPGPEVKREENLQKIRTFIIHLRNCEQWLSGLPDKVALALRELPKRDEEIKAFLILEFPNKMTEYIGMDVSVPEDVHFTLGFCAGRLRVLELLLAQLEKEP